MVKKPKHKASRKKATKQEKSASQGVSQAWLARHLDVTAARISQFVKEGEFVPKADGKLDADACRIRYIRWLRDETRRSSQSEAAKRVQEARAKEIELRTAMAAGQLYDGEDVEAVFADILGTLRSELSGIPAASTRDLTLRATIEKHLNAAIERCQGKFAEAEQALRAGEEVVLDGESE